MHSFYEIFPDCGDLGGLFFFGGMGCWFLRELRFILKVKGWIIWVGQGEFFVCNHPYVKCYGVTSLLNINPRNFENGASHKKVIIFLAKIVIKSDNFLWA